MDKDEIVNIRVVDYVADYISKLGVKNIFMLSGTGSVYLDDALAFHKDIGYICARHEAAAVTMASASSKLTGELGVVISTTGPGATNAIGGVVEAWVQVRYQHHRYCPVLEALEYKVLMLLKT
jgi:acetolactate synthase-1/2/3 large subunit